VAVPFSLCSKLSGAKPAPSPQTATEHGPWTAGNRVPRAGCHWKLERFGTDVTSVSRYQACHRPSTKIPSAHAPACSGRHAGSWQPAGLLESGLPAAGRPQTAGAGADSCAKRLACDCLVATATPARVVQAQRRPRREEHRGVAGRAGTNHQRRGRLDRDPGLDQGGGAATGPSPCSPRSSARSGDRKGLGRNLAEMQSLQSWRGRRRSGIKPYCPSSMPAD